MTEIVILVFLTAASDDVAIQKEAKLLAGNWEVVYAERRGKKLPPEKHGVGAIVFAEADAKGRKEPKGSASFATEIDPSKSPKRIVATATDEKKSALAGIYAVDGDTLTMCLGLNSSPPTQFKTTEDGGDEVLLRFKRVKVLAKAKDVLAAAKLARAQLDVQQFTLAAQAYKIKYDKYPAKLDDLLTPPDGKPFIETRDGVLKDPWGQPYKYDGAGPKNNGEKPDIWSDGPDGKGPAIGNWPVKK